MGGIAALFFRRYCNTLARVFYENNNPRLQGAVFRSGL